MANSIQLGTKIRFHAGQEVIVSRGGSCCTRFLKEEESGVYKVYNPSSIFGSIKAQRLLPDGTVEADPTIIFTAEKCAPTDTIPNFDPEKLEILI